MSPPSLRASARRRACRSTTPRPSPIIADEILEGAREGRSVADLIGCGSTILTSDDVMPGVARSHADDSGRGDISRRHQAGHRPRPDSARQAHEPKTRSCRARSSPTTARSSSTPAGARPTLTVVNTGDRPIQIGSHYHFFEANRALEFDRETSFGMHLDIPAGTAVRFEPGRGEGGDAGGVRRHRRDVRAERADRRQPRASEAAAAALQRARAARLQGS